METNIIFFFICYILTLLAATSLLYTWFNSHLPQLIFSILKLLGFKRKDTSFWSIQEDLNTYLEVKPREPLTWTDMDWESFASNSLNIFWGTLLTCPYCICYHFVFWFNFFACVLLYFIFNIPFIFCLIFLITTTTSQPILVHVLTGIVAKLHYIK